MTPSNVDDDDDDDDISHCRLVHHGAAASVSGNQIVTWIPATSTLVYASNAMLNITNLSVLQTENDDTGSSDIEQHHRQLRHVTKTLRCTMMEQSPSSAAVSVVSPVVITCVVTAKETASSSSSSTTALVTGFSNGMIQVWLYQHHEWSEHTITAPNAVSTTTTTRHDIEDDKFRSITAIDAVWLSSSSSSLSSSEQGDDGSTRRILQIAVGTSAGMTWYECTLDQTPSSTITTTTTIQLAMVTTKLVTQKCGAVASLHYSCMTLPSPPEQQSQQYSTVLLLLIGTAAPRNNKIHVYQCRCSSTGSNPESDSIETGPIQYGGCLMGHEDWVTTLSSWKNQDTNSMHFLLASGSQDARIRIWKFRTTVMADESTPNSTNNIDCTSANITKQNMTYDDKTMALDTQNNDTYLENDDGIADDEFYDDVGESRLEIVHASTPHDPDHPTVVAITSVTLEALLCGHEEGVTSVAWHPNPKPLYGIDQMLMSSSTDRTILLWSETPVDDQATNANYGGIWTPLTRVGSAGGILGGSVGSTLLGFCGITVEPIHGRTIVGHAYGGALHIWDVATSDATPSATNSIQWKASPCITGHFAGITDCSWEAGNGDYLLTVSNDQTCRLWAPMKSDSSNNQSAWLELARPQVHGYNLSTVASLSSHSHPHLMVTGADEKEIRVFDAPLTTLRLLETFSDVKSDSRLDPIQAERVERAYIPSLGLSNKASPLDAAAEDDETETDIESKSTSTSHAAVRLPLERDLGAVSLWPETQKLFGHDTEIYCLAAVTTTTGTSSDNHDGEITIVASSAKARDAPDAKIRLWNARTGQCIQVLSGGHRSTVATMDFSTNGVYLASSGKDRRLCLWKYRQSSDATMSTFDLAWAMDSAHRRIVWSVHFCPYESQMFASASRDGCIKVWYIQDDPTSPTSVKVTEVVHFSPSFERGGKPDAVTAISFAPVSWSNQAVLAVGLESGRIELWCVPYETRLSGIVSSGAPNLWSGLHPSLCHCDTVTKLAWRPIRVNAEDPNASAVDVNDKVSNVLFLASVSMDHGCRIFEIEFPLHA